jgi:hypothetical protein
LGDWLCVVVFFELGFVCFSRLVYVLWLQFVLSVVGKLKVCCVVMFCVPFPSTFVCRVALLTLMNKAVEASLKPCQFFFPIVLTMDGKNHVYIDLTVDINGRSHESHNAPHIQDDSRTTRTCRPVQRLIFLLCRRLCPMHVKTLQR